MNSEKPCADQARDALDDFADGRLAPESARKVARHLESCAQCREDIEQLRRFERAARAAHPDSAEIVEAAWTGTASWDEHLEDCRACREEMEAVRAAIPEEERRRPRLVGSTASPRRRSWMAPALAASLLVGAGVLVRLRRETPDASTARGRAAEVSDLVPAGELSRGSAELTFSWSGEGGGRYAVLFFTVEGRVIARIEASGTTLAADPRLRAQLEAEREFFWKVDPLDGGASVAGSRLIRVAWRP